MNVAEEEKFDGQRECGMEYDNANQHNLTSLGVCAIQNWHQIPDEEEAR